MDKSRVLRNILDFFKKSRDRTFKWVSDRRRSLYHYYPNEEPPMPPDCLFDLLPTHTYGANKSICLDAHRQEKKAFSHSSLNFLNATPTHQRLRNDNLRTVLRAKGKHGIFSLSFRGCIIRR